MTEFLAPFRVGENFFLIEAPGAAFEELGNALGMGPRELQRARGFCCTRPLLQGRSGFEIALRARPSQAMGADIAVVPKLTPEGTYFGSGLSHARTMRLQSSTMPARPRRR